MKKENIISGRGKWKAVLYAFLFPLILSSCVETGSGFHLEGKFKNINQGEFYLCDFDNGTKDTISLRDGQFIYDCEMSDTTIFTLIFPNYSELPIIATPGGRVKIKGDVSHLKETEITGTEENELLTGFRLQTKEMVPPEVKKKAEEFILNHPESPISLYLLRRYFILAVDADYSHILGLCKKMLAAKPTNIPLIQLHKRLVTTKQQKSSGEAGRHDRGVRGRTQARRRVPEGPRVHPPAHREGDEGRSRADEPLNP